MISQLSHGLENEVICGEVRWSHIRWEIAENLLQSRLKEIHLVDDSIVIKSGKIGMGPSVRRFSMINENNQAT